ncbi:hypothetical protein BCR32DRAFT_251667 [Anaeromyces robustus]|uniref:Uncharacterized protein n=1 Tax=Anaeromyces robustus TaxID=1754192 RepID=A0A1Y1VPR8_9FUNG|nr:hypothetical protein BCR32DRAFT_251667 [Anaeromyces robustus]|eukprot:ORX63277.1 hypothetical protein BCR32DRAFT_251667 [Anaeromyces robustus]
MTNFDPITDSSVEVNTDNNEPISEITEEEPLNEPVLINTIEEETYDTEIEESEEEYDWVNAAKEEYNQLKNPCWYYQHNVSNQCICNKRNDKDTEYFDQLLESAYKVQDALKQQKKFNSQVYHVNIVTDFIWDKPEENNELNMYKIMIKDFNLKIKNSKRKISSILKEQSKLKFKKSSLDEGYQYIDNMNCGPYEIFKDYKEKANVLSDIIMQIGNCNELISKYDQDIESELGSIVYYHNMINRYRLRYNNLLINSNKKLNEVYKKINTLDD